ncbi:hypothetical protein [Paraburkholderia unamae]|uniref:hypothetical protein n=1 Tax=Paraburkholderia unamae TaxID=219649 RepID=UPI003FD6F0E7
MVEVTAAVTAARGARPAADMAVDPAGAMVAAEATAAEVAAAEVAAAADVARAAWAARATSQICSLKTDQARLSYKGGPDALRGNPASMPG